MKRIFASLLAIAVCALAFPYLFVQAQEDQSRRSQEPAARPRTDLSRLVRQYQRVRLNPSEVAHKVRSTGRLSLVTEDQSFELELQPNDMRARGYRVEETGRDGIRREIESGPVRTYQGKALGREDAQARFTIDEGTFEGLIITPDERYYVEPLSKYSAGADHTEFLFYKKSDVIEDSPGMCGVTMNEKVNEAVQGIAPKVSEAAAAGATYTLLEAEVATEADYEYVTAMGGAVAATQEILSIMNQVDGVYDRELGIRLKIVYQHAWADRTASYPYTSTANGASVLQEFTNHWNVNFTQIRRDVAHMWTGKDIVNSANDSGLIGIAWTGVVCRAPDHAYGVSERLTSIAHKYVLTAHEIGHNFDASHSDAEPGCDDAIMRSYIGTTLSFCTFSRGEIRTYNADTANAACLTSIQVPCNYTLTPASATFPVIGGGGSVAVSTRGSCGWHAKSNVPWITITPGAGGPGNGLVKFTVAVNNMATSRTGTLTIGDKPLTVTQAANTVISLALNPATVMSGQSLNGTLTLSVPAPATGLTVGLSDNSTAITTPAQVSVPAGAKSQTFPISTAVVPTAQTGTITATLGAASKTTSLALRSLEISSLRLSQSSVAGGNSLTGTITLNGPAPSTGSVITLSDNMAATAFPGSLTIPAGATSGTFTITTAAVTANQSGAITVVYNGIARTGALTVRPVGVLSVEVNPNSITGGSSATATVLLERVAPGGVTVTLTDTLAATTIPASVVVPAGTVSQSFTITTKAVTAFQSGTLTARANGVSKNVSFALTPSATTTCAIPGFNLTTKVGLVMPLVVADDFNQDGKTDLVGPSGSGFAVLISKGLSGFEAPVRYAVSATRIAVSDFNLDGKRDLAVSNSRANTVSILLGDGTGRFGQPAIFSTVDGADFIAVGDFNGDAKPDLSVVGRYGNRQLAVLLGDGKGGLLNPASSRLADYAYGIAVGDFNGDGKQDVAMAHYIYVTVHFGDGAGGFTSWRRYELGVNSRASGLAVGDFNRDGKMDMAVSIISLNKVYIMRGDGLGGFTIPLKLNAGQNPEQVIVSDLNGDHKADLIIPNSGTHDVSVLFAAGPGNFNLAQNYSLGGTTLAPKSVAIGDFNGDDRLDLAAPMPSNVSIMVNTCQ